MANLTADSAPGQADHVPLSALLSQALVAFTIEFDNEFEHHMPHRTTNHGTTPGASHAPWLVSMVMWTRILQFVPLTGIRVRELQPLVGLSNKGMQTWLTRLGQWWGYLTVGPDQSSTQVTPSPADWLVRFTRAGEQAQSIWCSLGNRIEQRWEQRFGAEAIDHLRASLQTLITQIGGDLSESLPILGYGLFTAGPEREWLVPVRRTHDRDPVPLPALLSQVLYAIAREFEQGSPLSLAVCANLLHVLDERGVQIRNLPQLTGLSKEALSMSQGLLEEQHVALVESDAAGSRFKVLRLTAAGQQIQGATQKRLDAVETGWRKRYNNHTLSTLRTALERLAGSPSSPASPLFQGIHPYPDGWRAAVRQPDVLPYFPTMLHRGGFPDGS